MAQTGTHTLKVHCDGPDCSRSDPLFITGNSTYENQAEARRLGWVVSPSMTDGADRCPTCRKAAK